MIAADRHFLISGRRRVLHWNSDFDINNAESEMMRVA